MPSPPSDYRERFDERGAGYDDAMAHWPTARDEEFAFALGLTELRSGSRVLDVPAGGGYLADHLPVGVRYQALEVASSFAERCRGRGLAVIEGDLLGSSLPAASFDVVMSVAGLHHEPDLAAVLTQWRRLLRPGGHVVVVDVAEGSAMAAFLDGFVGRHNTVGHEGVFLGTDIDVTAKGAGYIDAAVIDGEYHWWFDDERSLGHYCKALFGLTGPTWEHVVDAARQGLGIDEAEDGRVGLRWGLRGLVAVSPEPEP